MPARCSLTRSAASASQLTNPPSLPPEFLRFLFHCFLLSTATRARSLVPALGASHIADIEQGLFLYVACVLLDYIYYLTRDMPFDLSIPHAGHVAAKSRKAKCGRKAAIIGWAAVLVLNSDTPSTGTQWQSQTALSSASLLIRNSPTELAPIPPRQTGSLPTSSPSSFAGHL